MSTPNSTNPQDYYLEELSKITGEIVKQSSSGNYIYRGEPETYDEYPHRGKVSSTLYRKYPTGTDSRTLSLLQKEILNDLKGYLSAYEQKDNFEILTELQHYGTETNLIDFTSDYHIALLFACNGSHDKDGRVILLKRSDEINIKYQIKKPLSPKNRVIAQKSIFAQPPNGYLDIEDIAIIPVPANLKQWILIHLRKFQDISTQSVFNDLHGFIRHRELSFSPKAIEPRVAAKRTWEKVPARDPLDEEQKKQLQAAIENCTSSLQYAPYDAPFYAELAYCYFLLDDISSAIETLSKAIWLKPDYEFAYYSRARIYTIQGDHVHSMGDFKMVIDFDSDLAAAAYYYRGIELLRLQHWQTAKSDLIVSNAKGKNIRFQFAIDFNSVSYYEQVFGVKLPEGISAILQPEQPPQT